MIRLLERLRWTWAVRCPECRRPGRCGARDEVLALAGVHNRLLHRGHPVASARLGWVIR
jgi:hypothetical protein